MFKYLFSDLIATFNEAVRYWKRTRRLRNYRASLKNEPNLPF